MSKFSEMLKSANEKAKEAAAPVRVGKKEAPEVVEINGVAFPPFLGQLIKTATEKKA